MRRPRKSINQINVVPYIDVMLVLLIIFMVTAPLVNPGEIKLPSVGATLPTPIAPLEVMVNKDRSLLLKEGSAPPARVSRDELVARIRERQGRDANQAVVIKADGSAPYQDVISVIDTLQQNNVRNVGLLAQPGGH